MPAPTVLLGQLRVAEVEADPEAGRNFQRNPLRIMATCSADAPLKGLRYLLRAYAQLLKTWPDLELLLVSKPNPGGATEKLVRAMVSPAASSNRASM